MPRKNSHAILIHLKSPAHIMQISINRENRLTYRLMIHLPDIRERDSMKIVTDCAADLPAEEIEALDITQAPLYIQFPRR